MKRQRFNILLVEDSLTEAKLFETILREVAPRASMYWVQTAQEAVEALHGSERFRDVAGFDIALLDLNLPGIDGFSLLEQLKGQRLQHGFTPLIVFSNSRNPKDINRAYELGANSYVTKPATLDANHEAIRLMARYWLEVCALPDGFPN